MKRLPMLESIFDLMCDGQQRTLEQVCVAVGGDTATVSARLRDLRKEQFGGHMVTRKHLGGKVYGYTLNVIVGRHTANPLALGANPRWGLGGRR